CFRELPTVFQQDDLNDEAVRGLSLFALRAARGAACQSSTERQTTSLPNVSRSAVMSVDYLGAPSPLVTVQLEHLRERCRR
ncbi:MAG: hypothetical protein WCF65_09505, partial [Parachlamydiaceae bacterium]